jgi:hypothetical protein
MADIYLQIKGRAGNQLSQYAFARLLKEKLGFETIYINFNIVNQADSTDSFLFQDDLRLFKTEYRESDKLELPIKTRTAWFIRRAIDALYSKVFKAQGFFKLPRFEKYTWRFFAKLGVISIYNIENISAFNKELPQMSFKSNVLIEGLFEDYRLNDMIRDILLEEYVPKTAELAKNESIYQHAKKENSVCLSIRRGDFLNAQFKDRHFITDESYYKKAIVEIKANIGTPTFLVFSDDMDYAKSFFEAEDNIIFEDGTDDIAEKIRIMSMCQHFIISNSTFSYWAMYLGQAENKIVVAPSVWKRPTKGYGNFSNLLKPEFKLIQVN